MANNVTVRFEYRGNVQRFNLVYANGDSEQLALTCVGRELYRLGESSFIGEAVYGDTICAEKAEDGSLLFKEIAERSKLITQSLILSAEFLQAERMRSILENVMSAGGMWEQAFGGLLIIHAPQEIATAVLDEIKEIWARR
jgi:hypothetical protein